MKKYLALILAFLVVVGCEDDPIKSENHRPIIFSLTAFPDVVEQSDSVIIICNAMDPDADTLVYDWITDGRVKIKGAPDYENFLYHTYENSRVVYPKDFIVPPDTLWVQCFARDVKGKSDAEVVLFIVRQDSARFN